MSCCNLTDIHTDRWMDSSNTLCKLILEEKHLFLRSKTIFPKKEKRLNLMTLKSMKIGAPRDVLIYK